MRGRKKKSNKRINASFESYDNDRVESHDDDVEPYDDVEESYDDVEEVDDYYKTKVKCICPACGIQHEMNLHWTGRGIPRKYCQICKKNI